MKIKQMQEAMVLNKQRVALKDFISKTAPEAMLSYGDDLHFAAKDLIAAAKMQLGRVEQSMRELGADLSA